MHVSGRQTRRPRFCFPQFRFAGQGFVSAVVRLAVLALLLPALLAVSPPRHARAASAGYVNTDVLNLREEPGTWSDVITRMYWGEYVDVLEGPTWDGWYLVDYWGTVGWSYGGYLLVDGSPGWSAWSEPGAAGSAAGTAWVSTDRLNVRVDASLDAWVMDQLSTGQEVTIVGGAVNGFVPIAYFGQTAWVWSDFLSYDGPVSAGPERWIDVDRSSQMVTLFVGEEAIASYWAAMGWDDSDYGFYATALGTYYVYGKHADLAWTEWGQAYIRSWVAFDAERLNGFHSWSMDENGNVLPKGDGPTGGCIALEPSAARHLYDFAEYGMRVVVHW